MIDLALDNIGTWPARLLAAFQAHETLLRAHHIEEQKTLDDDAWRPPRVPAYVPMALRPHNPHHAERERFLEELRAEFSKGYALRGFHCTRLTDNEVATIRSDGMTPPNGAMLRRRIEALQNEGRISAGAASRLIGLNEADQPNRVGRIYFVFTRALLLSETGVGSLFKFWGGEALYARHDRDPETGAVLASIGSPRIVEAYLAISDLGGWFPDRVMVQQFLAARGVDTGDRDFSSRTVLPVPAASISRVISRSDPEFELLTQTALWQAPVR